MKNIELYAYLDIGNPMVEWEVAIGRISSACDITRNNFGVSLWFYNNIKNKVLAGKSHYFINEMKLELLRQREFPLHVSRMTGVYFFDSKKMLEHAFKFWGRTLNDEYISKVKFSAKNITKVDSEWISQILIKIMMILHGCAHIGLVTPTGKIP